ncbi:MAG: hypothetical protein IGBAC_1118 [Ignavibacteriae bacterium]|nr:MAG: hypothetical protein IGBAC_1118 [Ignavibacteriota bacterium]
MNVTYDVFGILNYIFVFGLNGYNLKSTTALLLSSPKPVAAFTIIFSFLPKKA